jgi:import receptor subunit TOM20
MTGVIAYAFYFDYKRRNDAEFRKALKRDSKRSAKQAKLEAEASTRQRRDEIRALVDQVNQENLPSDAEGHEQFFMEEVSKGEQLLQDETKSIEAALSFFRALKVYPTPEELINIYDKTVPKVCLSCSSLSPGSRANDFLQHVLDILAEMIALDQHGFKSSKAPGPNAAAQFEDDV